MVLQRLTKNILEKYNINLLKQWPIESINVHCLIVNIPVFEQLNTIKKIESDSRVKWVQPYHFFEGQSIKLDKIKAEEKLDPYYKLQSIFELFNLTKVSDKFDGKGISIAIVDSGVEKEHPELIDSVAEKIDFVNLENINDIPAEHHGTGIAGVIIAKKDNGKGISGISPQAKLYAYRSCWETSHGKTICNSLTLARALDRVAQTKPDILNLSLTGPQDRLLDEILDRIIENETYVVTAYDKSRAHQSRFPKLRRGVVYVQSSNAENDTRV